MKLLITKSILARDESQGHEILLQTHSFKLHYSPTNIKSTKISTNATLAQQHNTCDK